MCCVSSRRRVSAVGRAGGEASAGDAISALCAQGANLLLRGDVTRARVRGLPHGAGSTRITTKNSSKSSCLLHDEGDTEWGGRTHAFVRTVLPGSPSKKRLNVAFCVGFVVCFSAALGVVVISREWNRDSKGRFGRGGGWVPMGNTCAHDHPSAKHNSPTLSVVPTPTD
jgi:hypothetical protein